jgi:hypothetical protein
VVRLIKLCGVAIALLFLISVVNPSWGFAETLKSEAMERKCEATNEGTEVDAQVKKACAMYFEQTEANVVTGVAAAAATPSITSVELYRSIAAIALGLSVMGAVIAPMF